jgi:competence protein ComGD
MNWNEKGFTLIEMLVVFSIFLVICSAGVIALRPQYLLLEKTSFFSQFKSDLFYAQQFAIAHQEIVAVNITAGNHYYYMRRRVTGPIIVSRQYDHEIDIREGTMPLYFQFSPDGNINRFGSFLIQIEQQMYRVSFYIGMGRFYVTKE